MHHLIFLTNTISKINLFNKMDLVGSNNDSKDMHQFARYWVHVSTCSCVKADSYEIYSEV